MQGASACLLPCAYVTHSRPCDIIFVLIQAMRLGGSTQPTHPSAFNFAIDLTERLVVADNTPLVDLLFSLAIGEELAILQEGCSSRCVLPSASSASKSPAASLTSFSAQQLPSHCAPSLTEVTIRVLRPEAVAAAPARHPGKGLFSVSNFVEMSEMKI